jgi:lysozyme family protein
MNTGEIVGWVIDTFEGKLYTDDPVDTGGATKFGITLRTLQYYRRTVLGRDRVVTKTDVRNLTREEAIACGVAVFAIEPRIAELADWRIRLVTYDYGFHSGQPRAVRALQEALGPPVVADGVIGPRTLSAVANHVDPLGVALRLLTRREEFMQSLVEAKPLQRKYLLGWWRRTTRLQRIVLGD